MISPEYPSIQANQISCGQQFHRHVPLHIHVSRLRSAPHSGARASTAAFSLGTRSNDINRLLSSGH